MTSPTEGTGPGRSPLHRPARGRAPKQNLPVAEEEALLRRRWQRRIFAIAWLSYGAFYLCRVNISVALPAIQADFGWTESTLGLIGSAFLWMYAAGQLINGTLGQKADARWFVGTAMLLSAGLCAAFGSMSSMAAMLVLWGLNGWVQSMGWGPIVKTIAAWFGSRRRGRITAFFGPCFVVGHLTAWSLGGWIVAHWGWRYAFWLPALVFGAMGVVWLLGIRSTPEAAGLPRENGDGDAPRTGLLQVFASLWLEPRVRWGALTCIFASMIKDGLVLWAPTLLKDSLGGSVAHAALGASILPLMGLLGAPLAGWLVDHVFHGDEGPAVVGLSLAIVLFMGGFLGFRTAGNPWILIGLLGLCGVAIYGINLILLTALPLSFGRGGHVAAIAGFLDFASYLGGGLSVLTVGQLLDRFSWNVVFVYWGIASICALAGGLALRRRSP